MDRETYELFEQGLLRFSQEHFDPSRAAQRAATQDGYQRQAWEQMKDLGWFDLLRDEQGSGLGRIVDLLPVYYFAGEYLWDLPLSSVFGGAAELVHDLENKALREDFLTGLQSAARPLALAHREHSDAWAEVPSDCKVSIGADVHQISGRKRLAIDLQVANEVIVSAVNAQGQTVLYLVDKHAPSLSIQRYPCIDGSIAHDLDLQSVPAQFLCQGDATWRRAVQRGSLLAGAESVGIMRGACQDTVAYLQQRKQFGRPLIGFQSLQHRLVDMQILLRESHALLLQAAAVFDAAAPDLPQQLLVLRAHLSRALRRITAEAVQMHGGMGVTQETRVARYYKRALMLDSLYGTSDWAFEKLAA